MRQTQTPAMFSPIRARKSAVVLAGPGAVLACALSLAACSGDSTADITQPDGSTDGGTVSNLDASTDGRGADAGSDAAPQTITELPAPSCNDLAQAGPTVTSKTAAGPAPSLTPVTTIPPGSYVVTEAVYYGGATPTSTTSRTTAFFTPTREYYVADNDGDPRSAHLRLTLDWKIQDGQLVRTIVCYSLDGGAPTAPPLRLGASPDGFTVLIDSVIVDGGVETLRYVRAP